MYSKRWELVHILGGKCVDCGNGNFYDLEIDHIYNDGDGDRKYYTIPLKKYINNPKRAKERLQVRCKQCHENRHHAKITKIDNVVGSDIGVFAVKDGVIQPGGTDLGNCSEVVLVALKNCKPVKILERVAIN